LAPPLWTTTASPLVPDFTRVIMQPTGKLALLAVGIEMLQAEEYSIVLSMSVTLGESVDAL
jgi:hypothetical protein